MTYEVSAAAKPPQTTPLHICIRVDTREGNGEYRRCRAVVQLPRFLSHLSHFDGLDVRIAPRRAGGDTRRFVPVCRHECRHKGGLSVAVSPPPTLRTSLFARHSRRFTTQNSLLHSTRGNNSKIDGVGHLSPRRQNLDIESVSRRFWNKTILRARARRTRARTRLRQRPQTPQLRRWEVHRDIPAASGWRASTSPSIWPREASFPRALFTISGGENSTLEGRATDIHRGLR